MNEKAPQLIATQTGPDVSPAAGPRLAPWPVIAGVIAVVGVLIVVGVLVLLPRLGDGSSEGLVFEIPAGTYRTIDQPTIDSAIEIPTRIHFRSGEPAVITVRNFDSVAHRAGPFVVGPEQTYIQRFPGPGEYPIACAVDPAESVIVLVDA